MPPNSLLTEIQLDDIVAEIKDYRSVTLEGLRKILDNKKEIYRRLIETDPEFKRWINQEMERLSLFEQLRVRENIVDELNEELGVEIDYPKLDPSAYAFKKGSLVRIKPNCYYADENSGTGILQGKFRSPEVEVNVHFEDGGRNTYKQKYLEVI